MNLSVWIIVLPEAARFAAQATVKQINLGSDSVLHVIPPNASAFIYRQKSLLSFDLGW
jgi:hypothetical protein